MESIEVGILGATGMVGQHFIRFLEGHPWFKLTWLGASDRSAGKAYKDATVWRLEGDMPPSVADLVVSESKTGSAPRLVFSAMDASVATEIEREFCVQPDEPRRPYRCWRHPNVEPIGQTGICILERKAECHR